MERWDIFCRVVDNYGDVGVSWRLARALAREHRKDVRLWLDDVAVLARLRPELDPGSEGQRLEGVEVRLARGVVGRPAHHRLEQLTRRAVGLPGLVAGGQGGANGSARQGDAVIERFTPAADYSGTGTGEVTFMIHEGDTGSSIAQNLVDEGVTASYDAFYDLLLEQSPEPEFHPGAYRLAEEMSAKAALDALMDPANKLA